MIQTWRPTVARMFLGALFVVSGLQMVWHFSGTVGYVGSVIGVSGIMATLATIVVLAMKVLGGLSVMANYHAKWGARALVVFTALTIVLVHNSMADVVQALKNLAIIGGLLLVCEFDCAKSSSGGSSM